MAMTKIRFSQINLYHCKSASAMLARSMAKMHTHIVLIQEKLNSSGQLFVGTNDSDARACIAMKGINAVLLPQLCGLQWSRPFTTPTMKKLL